MRQAIPILFIILHLVFFEVNILSRSPENANLDESKSSHLLKEVEDQFWQFLLENSNYSLYLCQKFGLEIKHLPDLSFKKSESDILRFKAWLQKLTKVKPAKISYDEYLTLEILKWEMENQIKGHIFFWLNIPIAAYNSPIPYVNQVFTEFQFKEKKHLGQYLMLLNQYPTFIDGVLQLLKHQFQKKIILPRDALVMPVFYLNSLIQPAHKSTFYVKENRLKNFSLMPSQIKEFQQKVYAIVTSRLNPGLKRLLAFLQGEYSKMAPEAVGTWQYPRGKDYYCFLVKYNTSLDLTPEEIHQIGLREIKKLIGKMDEIRQKIKFKGDNKTFFHFLKNNPAFKPKSAEEIGQRMEKFKELAKAKLNLYFYRLPKAPCTVKRLDPLLEDSMTYGYYQTPTAADPKGYYLYNASNLENKNILNTASAALILHELLPGHHFQISVQAENPKLSPFRREYFLSSFAEGWAEYASQLGVEMGIYYDPFEQCGLLFQDLFMSVRLVVDTGMNYFQWPRERAKEMMKKYLLISAHETETETLRYSTGIPAQALAYKIGSLKMWELRERAEKTLGKLFDVRRFHDALLGKGSMPLFLLEKHIKRFIQQETIFKSR